MSTEAYERLDEYNRFGPWIDEVTEPALVPPLFRSYPLSFAPDITMLKVPRPIARRDANPSMDLYDRLVIIDHDAVTVLTRNESIRPRRNAPPPPRGFTVERIAYPDVVAVDDSANLLDGRYRIHSSRGTTVAFSFNGAGRAGLAGLTATLRQRMASSHQAGAAQGQRTLVATGHERHVDLDALEDSGDVGLATSMRAVTRRLPNVAAWACHPHERLTPSAPGVRGTLQRLAHASKPAVLQGCAMGGDEHLVIFVGRHDQLTRGTTQVISNRELTVSLDALDRIEIAGHPRYPSVVVATLVAGYCELPILAPRDSEMHAILAGAR